MSRIHLAFALSIVCVSVTCHAATVEWNMIALDENGSYTYMDALFNATDYSDLVNKAEYIQSVDSYNNKV